MTTVCAENAPGTGATVKKTDMELGLKNKQTQVTCRTTAKGQ